MTEPMSPAAIQQRLKSRVRSGNDLPSDHAQRWRESDQKVDPILVVVADSTDRTSVSEARKFCAKASRKVLLTVLLLAFPASGSLGRLSGQIRLREALAEVAGETWCTLALASTDPYGDAIRIAHALALRVPGLIGVDFQDVMTVLADGLTGARAYDRRRGHDRAEQVATNVLRTLTALGVRLRRAAGLFVHMTSGQELKHGEIKTIANLLRANVADDTHITLSHAYRTQSRPSKAPSLELDVIVTFDAKANRPARLEAGSVFGNQIDNEDLTLFDIPEVGADWQAVAEFALTFDGHAHWGSNEKCAEIANAHQHGSLTELRTCLFFEQRRWRHFAEEPDKEAIAYIREILQKIRSRVDSGRVD